MDLVAMIVSFGVVTNQGSVGKAERSTRLLAHNNACDRRSGTIANTELVGIGECFDRATEFFNGSQVKVLNIVGVLRVVFRTGRRLSNSGQAIPCHTVSVGTISVLNKQHTMVCTCFIKAFANDVPYKLRHVGILLILEI
jgi:hypothetical protein